MFHSGCGATYCVQVSQLVRLAKSSDMTRDEILAWAYAMSFRASDVGGRDAFE